MFPMDLLGDAYVDNVRLDKVSLPRRSRAPRDGHTLPLYADDVFIKERKNGNEEVHTIKTFVVCDEEPYYEKPLVPNYGRNSSAYEKEICGATNTKTRYPQFTQHSTRLATFVHGPFFTQYQTLADLGFFYKGQGDRVCCYECGLTLSRWRKDDDPLIEHIRYSPECRYLATIIDTTTLKDYKAQLQLLSANETSQGATGVRLESTSSQQERKNIRSPEYESYIARLSTFVRFPAIYGLDVNQIAAAGFYYTGQQDIVRCYACDGGLKRWEPGDDPWEEHSRWFPDCHHLEQSNYQAPDKKTKAETGCIHSEEKPVASVGKASLSVELAQRMKEFTFEEEEPNKQKVEPDLNTPAALAVVDFGYSRKAVTMAIKELNRRGQTTLTANGILQVLVSFEDRGIRLPADDDVKDSDSKNSVLSDLEKVSSTDLPSEKQLSGRKTNKTVTSETRDKDVSHLLEDNEKLIKQAMCKRCRERQRNVLLLPCTHFCLCEQCSKEVSLCPECWKPIKERIKTYVS